jgi:cation diffusion facilitator CzcD-associated flavoprotein CzcO
MTVVDDRTPPGAHDPSVGSAGGEGDQPPEHHRLVIVGTGFSGIGLAARLLEQGETDFVVLERDAGPGGTWRANTYPGCQCDVPSNLYSLSFAPNPDWTTTFPLQPEIQQYLVDVTQRFGITPHVRYRTPMLGAEWDEGAARWKVETPDGVLTCDHLVLGVGGLAEPALPDIPGVESFEGATFHTARWDHEHDLTGERVAVIGTGASAIQVVPSIQPIVGQLDLYQRTPAWVMPHPNRPVTPRERRLYRRYPLLQKARRALTYAALEARVIAFAKRPKLMKAAEKVGVEHIREAISDPDLVDRLTPRYELGCKRVLLSDTYYPALAAENADVVAGGAVAITPTGVVGADGVERPADTIVFATGFHVTDSPTYQLVRGRDGRTLGDAFLEHGAYKGTTCRGFPNLWVMAGPNTGIGHTSLVYMIESQIRYVLDALHVVQEQGLGSVEPDPPTQRRWFETIQQMTEGTIWASGCQSWYLDAEGRNGAIWPGWTWAFRHQTRRFDLEHYEVRAPVREPATR